MKVSNNQHKLDSRNICMTLGQHVRQSVWSEGCEFWDNYRKQKPNQLYCNWTVWRKAVWKKRTEGHECFLILSKRENFFFFSLWNYSTLDERAFKTNEFLFTLWRAHQATLWPWSVLSGGRRRVTTFMLRRGIMASAQFKGILPYSYCIGYLLLYSKLSQNLLA